MSSIQTKLLVGYLSPINGVRMDKILTIPTDLWESNSRKKKRAMIAQMLGISENYVMKWEVQDDET